jgi:hypothetical protein
MRRSCMLSVRSNGHTGYAEADWDGALQRLGGNLLQSWRWESSSSAMGGG